jgi:hypothetical protein
MDKLLHERTEEIACWTCKHFAEGDPPMRVSDTWDDGTLHDCLHPELDDSDTEAHLVDAYKIQKQQCRGYAPKERKLCPKHQISTLIDKPCPSCYDEERKKAGIWAE